MSIKRETCAWRHKEVDWSFEQVNISVIPFSFILVGLNCILHNAQSVGPQETPSFVSARVSTNENRGYYTAQGYEFYLRDTFSARR